MLGGRFLIPIVKFFITSLIGINTNYSGISQITDNEREKNDNKISNRGDSS